MSNLSGSHQSDPQVPIQQSIGFNLLRRVFSIYIFVATLVTLAHMLIEYSNTQQQFKDDLALYQSTYQTQLADALWDLDYERVDTIVNGIIKLPSVSAIDIFDLSNNSIAQVRPNNTITIDDMPIRHEFTITYLRESERSEVGYAKFYTSRKLVVNQLSMGFVLIVVNAVIKTIALWAIFLWLVKPMLIRPLEQFSREVRRLDIEQPEQIKLNLYSDRRDEIKILEESFNCLSSRLSDSLYQTRETAAALNRSNNYLEQLVSSAQNMMQANSHINLFEMYIQSLTKGIKTLDIQSCAIFNLTQSNRPDWRQFKTSSCGGETKLVPLMHDERQVSQLDALSEQAEIFIADGDTHFLNIHIETQQRSLAKVLLTVDSNLIISNNVMFFITNLSQMLALCLIQTSGKRELENQVKERTHELKLSNLQIKRKAKELEKANHHKSIFLANMSHEIRTPMNGVFGSLQLLREQVENESLKETIEVGVQSCQSLLTIINDILDFSKIDAGKIELTLSACRIDKIIEQTIAELADQANKKDISVNFIADDPTPSYWFADAVRIKQILLNIIANGVKFTHQGYVQVRLKYTDQGVIVTVTDTGIGMSPDAVKSIFNRFEQVDSSVTRNYGGTGLGTSIALSLVKLMHGEISVESELHKGSTFTIVLPLKKAEEPQQDNREKSNEVPNLAGKTILLAEDNNINITIIKKMLEPTNVELRIANNGQECLDCVAISEPDLVLMDIQMPVMDGIAACKELKKYYAFPVLALTANVMTEDRAQYAAANFDSVIGKPIDVAELYSACEQFLLSDGVTIKNT